MDEGDSSVPEEVADDEITVDASPGKSIANLKSQLANAQPFDISTLGPTQSKPSESAK